MRRLQIECVLRTCYKNQAPVPVELIRDALDFIQAARLNYAWNAPLEVQLDTRVPSDTMVQHSKDILDYVRRMHWFGGEDIPLVTGITEEVYCGLCACTDTEVIALWWTWVYDVLAMLEDNSLNRVYLSYEEATARFAAGEDVWFITDPENYVSGIDAEDEDEDAHPDAELVTFYSVEHGDTLEDLDQHTIYLDIDAIEAVKGELE